MMTSDKILLESRGYLFGKFGGIDRAYKNPMVFRTTTQPKIENLTRAFMEYLKNQPVVFLGSNVLAGKSPEERDILVIQLINS